MSESSSARKPCHALLHIVASRQCGIDQECYVHFCPQKITGEDGLEAISPHAMSPYGNGVPWYKLTYVSDLASLPSPDVLTWSGNQPLVLVQASLFGAA